MPRTLGDTFAESSNKLRRLQDLTFRLCRLNDNGWREDDKQQLYWRFVVAIPIPLDLFDLSDEKLSLQMLESAVEVLKERISSLKPQDGVERVEKPRKKTA